MGFYRHDQWGLLALLTNMEYRSSDMKTNSSPESTSTEKKQTPKQRKKGNNNHYIVMHNQHEHAMKMISVWLCSLGSYEVVCIAKVQVGMI